jgi:RNA recognition motif-containing protein
VTYSTDAEAAAALERFKDQELGGRRLNINEAEERPRRPRSMGEPPPFDDFGFDGGGSHRKPFKAKGSRRGLRARKRSL